MWKLSLPGVLSTVLLACLLGAAAPANAQCVDNDKDGYGSPGDKSCTNGAEEDCDDTNADVNPGETEVTCNTLDDDCDPLTLDAPDADLDTYTVCDGDCDDADDQVNPGMAEVCGDKIDNDCDPLTLDVGDSDGDGYDCDVDCDDADPDVNPGAAEECDGVDTDCDGAPGPLEVDGDSDGWLACIECDDTDPLLNLDDADGDGYSTCHDDCDDADAEVFPGNPELCDKIDNDCDPKTDENIDGDGDGLTVCDGDCDDTDETTYPGAPELCDKVDNDCDPLTDETVDDDGDGFSECDPKSPDCDDDDADVFIGADEDCNGIDDNCDGTIDEGYDEDGDTYTTCGEDGETGTDDDDCDDADAAVNPGAAEVCDDTIDNNCDGLTDGEDTEMCGNAVPIADAGYDQQSRYLAGQVTLAFDGSGSEDAEGTNLTYSWEVSEFPDGVDYNLVTSTTSPYAFLVVTVNDAGAGGPWDFALSLVVTDADNNGSDPDFVKGHIYIDDPMLTPGRCAVSATQRPSTVGLAALLGGLVLLALRRR